MRVAGRMAEAKAVVGVSRNEMQVDMEYILSCHLTVGNYPIQPLTLEGLIYSSSDFPSCGGDRFLSPRRERCKITCVRLRNDYDMTNGCRVEVHKPKDGIVLVHNACRSLFGYDVTKDTLAHTYLPL